MKKPTIAAVNGYAVTGALELVISCDIIIAAESARFADTHARVGIVPGAGMSQILPRLVGPVKAREMSFTGEFIDAAEALSFGLVGRVVPDDKLMETALDIAEKIRKTNKGALLKIKEIINGGLRLTLADGMALGGPGVHEVARSHRPGPLPGGAQGGGEREEVVIHRPPAETAGCGC